MKNKGRRADHILADIFPELTRSQMKDLIRHGKVQYKNETGVFVPLNKAGAFFNGEYEKASYWSVESQDWTRFVSRGGLKLEGALSHFSLPVSGKVCLDVGLSTGGFSDCLLQNSARSVLGIDVGRGQLHERLQKEPRLQWRDRVNARRPLPDDLCQDFFQFPPHFFDLIVVDVSFISLGKLVPNLVSYLQTGGLLLTLVKPQFELGPEALNGQGVVKSGIDSFIAVEKNIGMFVENRLKIRGHCLSAIEGENGNQEYFVLSEKVEI